MGRFFITGLLITAFFSASAQDLSYARYLVDSLCSPELHGRGYVLDGDKKAAEFIKNEMKSHGVRPFSESYLQSFTIPINTFPSELSVLVDADSLIPGEDFVVYASSTGTSGTYTLLWENALPPDAIIEDPPGTIVVTDSSARSMKGSNPYRVAGYIHLTEQEHPAWHVSDGGRINDHFSLLFRKEVLTEQAKTLSIKIIHKYYDRYPTQNVVGYVEGTRFPDSFLVITAHYDHLGRMGRSTFFPGGHDNASGTAMMLDLAAYFAEPENRLPWSVAFLAFGAEEAGLHGSFYFAEHPLFPLESIRFLVNLDLVGSGSGGIKVVNGSVFTEPFERLVALNDSLDLMSSVSPRGAAANSDHYPFYAAGVPGFFIYTLGDESKEYHTIYDNPENVPFTDYEDLFSLIVGFFKTFQ